MRVVPLLSPDAGRAQAALVASLQRALAARGAVRLIETHISYVLLVGRTAYKIKKAVNLGFLDFSTLEKRRRYCEEELRLNRRLAPKLYRAVVALTGAPDAPQIGGAGVPLEYAVEMRRFAQSALLSSRLASKRLPPEVIDMLAERVAEFHAQTECCPPDAGFGSPEAVWAPVAENFRQLRRLLPASGYAGRLQALEAWSRDRCADFADLITARKLDGRVRECHGDLHLGNVALIRGKPVIFDCIEFNPELRWIDVINEVAFMTMDLEERGRPDYAHRFLDRWLEETGDCGGLALLTFYQSYRALVRAKVAAIRASQETPEDRHRDGAVCDQYIACAQRAMYGRQRFLGLMHGVSGAGKSWVSQILLETSGAVRLRSDVERKRLAGLAARGNSHSVSGGIYGPEMTAATYARLAEQARTVLAAGFPVIVDAASLAAWQRRLFRSLAAEQGIPFRLIDCQAPETVLRQRLAARARAGSDPSEADWAVLTEQLRSQEPLSADECVDCLRVATVDITREDLSRSLAGFPGGASAGT